MLQDLHSHTYFSFCGKDEPREVIEAAIAGGLQMLGLSDHSYGVGVQREYRYAPQEHAFLVDYQRCLNAYLELQQLLKEKYADKIQLKCGIEVPSAPYAYMLLPAGADISGFDYCLLEHLDFPDTTQPDLFAFAKRCGCGRVGIAHTDLPAFIRRQGLDITDYFKRMAEQRIFWELNVSYDSIHNFKEHAYVEAFFADEALQEAVRRSGVELSVGFDGHRVAEYKPDRVKDYCRRVEALGIPMAFEKE